MQLSLVFRAVLLFSLLAHSLDGAASEKKCKRKGHLKDSGAGQKSKRQKKKAWITVDSTRNISMVATPSPDRSLSPWIYETSFYNSQIPSEISEAKCEKKGCLTEDGEEDLGLESRPIYYQINILRRVKGKNATHYALKLDIKKVRVGCTCVLPVVVPHN